MYNRYIPQSDGSFRRSYIPDPQPPAPPKKQPPQEPEHGTAVPPQRPTMHSRPAPLREARHPQPVSPGNFLKQLLPKNFDTEDLLIVLLLILMAGDCREDQNTALLTLVLYLFL